MGMGVPTLGGFLGGAKTLLRVFSNDELDRMDAERERAAMPQEPILALAAHVRAAFDAAVNHRQTSGVTDRLLRCQRQRLGVYEPEKAAAIRSQGGSDLYFNLTDTKCSAAEGWMRALAVLLQPINELPLRQSIMLAIWIIIGRGRLNVAQTGSENG